MDHLYLLSLLLLPGSALGRAVYGGGPSPWELSLCRSGWPSQTFPCYFQGPVTWLVSAVWLSLTWIVPFCSFEVIETVLAVKTVSSRLLRRSAKRLLMQLAKACLTAQVRPVLLEYFPQVPVCVWEMKLFQVDEYSPFLTSHAELSWLHSLICGTLVTSLWRPIIIFFSLFVSLSFTSFPSLHSPSSLRIHSNVL